MHFVTFTVWPKKYIPSELSVRVNRVKSFYSLSMRLVVFVISSINIILSAYRGGATRVKKAK